MDRRFFLQGLGMVAGSQLLLGCQSRNQAVLVVEILTRSVPPQLIGKFRSDSKLSVEVNLKSSVEDLFLKLQNWQQLAASSNKQESSKMPSPLRLVSLGDAWLLPAIQQKLIQPLPVDQLTRWADLPPRWQQLVQRDDKGQLAPKGDIWGAPYRWGATLIAYRRDKFKALGWQPTDWADLWRPELQGRISLLNQGREVIGLTLKKRSKSYNTENPEAVTDLLKDLKALNHQVKFYDSQHYLEPLILGDSWVAVGWSTDIFAAMAQEPEIAVVMPQAGTALWADLWVQAQSTVAPSVAQAASQWINFWWDSTVAKDLSRFTQGLSPFARVEQLTDKTQQLLVENLQSFERSEFLTPLSAPSLKQYQRLWQQMRTTA
ncbi:MAG: extracellular solute-binding protein [Acaryochloridaceae cyanobacterium SU_2_1]|nr:extracellular solute-binding protein [Acaryochloridaceae cyanobacterium SU_2_1]